MIFMTARLDRANAYIMRTIFFSWQLDTSPTTGRNLVERALERAVARLGDDVELEEAVRDLAIDKDTEGVAGSPPIVDTIFKKIDGATVFVPDLSFVGTRPDGRPTPNPNVLIEYGWALKSLGHSRMVPVMNSAFGEPTSETMPFDMRHLRYPITYSCPADASEETRKAERDSLSKKLEGALKAVLKDVGAATEPALSHFKPRDPVDLLGRYKPKGTPIGVTEDRLVGRARPVKLSEAPLMWLRVMPKTDPKRLWSLAEIRAKATGNQFTHPVSRGWSGYSFFQGSEVFGVYPVMANPGDDLLAAVLVFSNGEIWSADAYYVQAMGEGQRNSVPLKEDDWSDSLEEYASFLASLGISPPFRWIAGMEGIEGRGIFVPTRPGYMSIHSEPRGHCLEDAVVCDGEFSPGESAKKALKPFFEKLYENCGLSRPAHLDEVVD